VKLALNGATQCSNVTVGVATSLAFDGAHIWYGLFTSNGVSELRASDCGYLGPSTPAGRRTPSPSMAPTSGLRTI